MVNTWDHRQFINQKKRGINQKGAFSGSTQTSGDYNLETLNEQGYVIMINNAELASATTGSQTHLASATTDCLSGVILGGVGKFGEPGDRPDFNAGFLEHLAGNRKILVPVRVRLVGRVGDEFLQA